MEANGELNSRWADLFSGRRLTCGNGCEGAHQQVQVECRLGSATRQMECRSGEQASPHKGA